MWRKIGRQVEGEGVGAQRGREEEGKEWQRREVGRGVYQRSDDSDGELLNNSMNIKRKCPV